MDTDMLSALNGSLVGTVLRLGNDFGNITCTDDLRTARELSRPVDSLHNARKYFNNLCDLCIRICLRAKEYRNNQDQRIIRAIYDYVDQHYMDAMLNTAPLTEQLHISQSYFPQFFKKHANQSFAEYLEMVRIRKATELLKTEELSIEQIAQEVGYNSAHSFRRSFKRVMGVPPSEYIPEDHDHKETSSI